MKIITAILITWFVALAGIQAYHSGIKQGRRESLETLRESRLQAYDAGNRTGRAEAGKTYDLGFEACQEQF